MLNLNILSIEQLNRIVEKLRKEKKIIVLTNGCFDIIHAGHVSSLTYAKEQGDILIVAINDDQSVRRLKGETRPILPLDMRAKVLCALRPVDFVTAFSQDNAVGIIKAIEPDVYVKSEEYDLLKTPEGIEVSKYGGKLISSPQLPRISTTAIIEKICFGGGIRK